MDTGKTILISIGILIVGGIGFLLYSLQPKEVAIENPLPDATTTPASTTPKIISLYYYNPESDKDARGNILCSSKGLIPVARTLSATNDPITATLQLLLEGKLTDAEKAAGITTEFPMPGVSITETHLNGKELTVTFEDKELRTTGGSCRITVLRAQVETTAKQFPEVSTVTFLPDDVFQP